MNFFVIGTDHTFQNREAGFEGLLRGLMAQQFVEPLQAIAEEYHEKLEESICQRLAKEHHLRWYNLDLTAAEKLRAGILQEQRGRPMSASNDRVTYRISSDDVREDAWVEKLISSKVEMTLVICGYLHFEPLVQRLRDKRHIVDKRAYLETIPEIKFASELAR